MPQTDVAAVFDQQTPPPTRVLAGLVDATAVAAPTILAAAALAERFTITGEVDGSPLFSEPDQLRINEIDEGFNRAVRLGDSVLTLSGGGWWLTMITLMTLTLVIFVLLPSKLRWRTPGRIALGLGRPSEPAPVEEPVALVAVVDQAATPNPPTGASFDDSVPPAPSAAPTGSSPTSTEVAAAPTLSIAPTPTSTSTSAPTSTSTPTSSATSASTNGPIVPSTVVGPAQVLASPTVRITLADADEYLDWDERLTELEGCSVRETSASASRFGALKLPESSLAETPLLASTTTLSRHRPVSDGSSVTVTASRSLADSPRSKPSSVTSAARRPATAEAPVWSDVCQAWIYQDPGSDRWFRHDTEQNRWLPIK